MARRAQGSTEYIIILGVALIVMVAALSFVVVEPQFAYSAKKQRSDEYWANARPFTIKSHAISQGHVILEVQNAEPVSLSVKEIRANGISINFSKISSPYNESAIPMCAGGTCNMPMSPGKTSIVITDNLNISEILQNICFTGNTFQEGRYYEVNLSISYQGEGGSETQASDIPIIGQCMRINLNDTTVGTLSITTNYLPSGEIGTPYTATLTATGCAGSCTWSFTGLPWSPSSQSGTSSCNNGASAYELTGTPSVNGTTIVSVTVTDSEGRTDTKQFGLMTEYPPVALRIVTETLPDGMAGVQYKATVAATGGTYTGYSWNYTGDLPGGYSAAQHGDEYVIYGTSEDVRTFRPDMVVRDRLGHTANKLLNLTIVELAELRIQETSPLPYATLNESYSTVLTASGCVGTCRWFVSGFPYASESDPPVGGEGNEWDNGMSGPGGSNTYLLGGVPAVLGNANLTVTLADDYRQYGKQFVLPVYPKLKITTASPLPEGTQYQYYSTILEADGCMQPCSWNVTLPAGWAQWSEEEGAMQGLGGSYTGYYSSYPFGFTANNTGTSTITANISDAVGRVATKTFTISINAPGAPLRITTASLPDAMAGAPYSAIIQATGGAQNYSAWNPAAGWPSGLQMTMLPNGNARLAGTPADGTNGTYTRSITVYDANWTNASKTFNLTIMPALQITTASPLPSVNVSTSYSTLISATGGTGTYSAWSYSTLPPGLFASYAPSQQLRISGTPATSGTYTFNATIYDTGGHTATKAFELAVNPPNFAFSTISPLPSGVQGEFYGTSINATGCEEGDIVEWQTAPLLPSGITGTGFGNCNQGKVTFELYGTPAYAGDYVINLNATKVGGQKIIGNFALHIAPPNLPRITGAAATGCVNLRQSWVWQPNYAINVTMSNPIIDPLLATGGTQPYTWSCAGDMPEGVRCYPDGTFEIRTTSHYLSPQWYVAKRVNITVTDAAGKKDSVLTWIGWTNANPTAGNRAVLRDEFATACLPDSLNSPTITGSASLAELIDDYENGYFNNECNGMCLNGDVPNCPLSQGSWSFSTQPNSLQGTFSGTGITVAPGGSSALLIPIELSKLRNMPYQDQGMGGVQCIPVTVHNGDGWAPRN